MAAAYAIAVVVAFAASTALSVEQSVAPKPLPEKSAGVPRVATAALTEVKIVSMPTLAPPQVNVTVLQDDSASKVVTVTYGLLIGLGQELRINHVWYLDMTQGYRWLTHAVDELVDQALADGGNLDAHPIGRLAPFIEQMFTHRDEAGNVTRRKEFWWEREWRKVGTVTLPEHIIVLCPEEDFANFREVAAEVVYRTAVFIDPRWGLEQIISRLAGYPPEHSDIL
jgi:hypothetical protein